MAYKVGTTIVIDDSGNVDWSRIANKPVIGAGTITSVDVVNGTVGAGVNIGLRSTGGNCNCTANCYVTSLSGGGATGAVSIMASRSSFNCNCACRC